MPKVIPEYKEEAKKRILEIATQIMLKKGYLNLKMEDISKEAGISRATLYIYYKNREELVLAILSNIISDVVNTAEISLNNSNSEYDGGFFERVNNEYHESYSIFTEVIYIMHRVDNEILTAIGDLHTDIIRQITRQIENKYPELKKKGIEPSVVANALLSLFIGLQTRIKLGMSVKEAGEIWTSVFTSYIRIPRS